MDLATSAARLILAAVLALAAGAKLLDRPGMRRALRDFGVAAQPAGSLAWIVPALELVAAAGLVLRPTARLAALLAAGLLVAFSLAIARVLRRGERPDCNCFGQLSSAAVGTGVVARNAVLTAAAALVAAAGPGRALAWWAVAVAAAIVAALLARTWRARPARAPRVGDRAPKLAARDARGRPTSLERALEAGVPAAVVFVSPECGPCRALVPELVRWASALEGRLALVTVEDGKAWGIEATPSAVIVAPGGRVASGVAAGVAGVEALVRAQLFPRPL